jgi:hypothetical protein
MLRPLMAPPMAIHSPATGRDRAKMIESGALAVLILALDLAAGFVIASESVQGRSTVLHAVMGLGFYAVAVAMLALVLGHCGAQQLVGRDAPARLPFALATVICTGLLAVTYVSYVLSA